MIVDTGPTSVTRNDGTVVVCHKADVSMAMSDSVAMRIVPIAPDGTPYPEAAQALIIPAAEESQTPYMREFFSSVADAVHTVLANT